MIHQDQDESQEVAVGLGLGCHCGGPLFQKSTLVAFLFIIRNTKYGQK